ncbi:MAG: YfcC family protein [Lawsonibacter sp.]|nr:YfcC family protein [Lawsonibacter sp.]
MSEHTGETLRKKKWEFPHPFVVLVLLLALMAVLTWILPASQYDMVTVNGVTAVDPDSFHYVDRTPVGIFDFLKAIPQGIQMQITLLSMIFTIGAFVHLVDSTGAIRAALVGMARKLGDKNGKFILAGIMVFFLCIGAFPSMFEGCIPFLPIGISIALMLGYDVVTGMAIIVVSDIIGWTAGPTNPWTTGTAQNLGGLPMYSGLGYRLVVLVVFGAIAIWFVLRYAERVKKDPTKSLVYGKDYSDMDNKDVTAGLEFDARRKLILLVFCLTIALVVYGSIAWGWSPTDMGAVYLISAVLCGVIAGYNSAKIAETMLKGAEGIFVAAMAIGVARGISVIMDNGQITYTIVHALAPLLAGLPAALTGVGMMLVQSVINFFIPSGSSQCLVTMPILMPVAELIGMSKQVTILAFQFGDGLSNLGYPSVALVVACLSYSRIPFNKWLKFILPFLGIIYIAATVLIIIASAIGY